MPVSKLVYVSSLRRRLGAAVNDDVTSLLAEALDSATVYLSSYLRTGFDRGVFTDVFFLDKYGQDRQSPFTSLLMSRGWVDSGESFTLRTAPVLSELSTGDLVDAKYFRLSADVGMVTLEKERTGGLFPYRLTAHDEYLVQVDYTAGFSTEETIDGDTYTGVPEWLQEAALLVAAHIYEGMTCKDEGDEYLKALPSLLDRVASRHIRFHPEAEKSIP